MMLRNEGRPTGFGAIAGPFMAPTTRPAMRKDLAALKCLLESG